jgi:hypothetical protein
MDGELGLRIAERDKRTLTEETINLQYTFWYKSLEQNFQARVHTNTQQCYPKRKLLLV